MEEGFVAFNLCPRAGVPIPFERRKWVRLLAILENRPRLLPAEAVVTEPACRVRRCKKKEVEGEDSARRYRTH